MTADYRYLLTDSSAGTPIAEVPLEVGAFAYVLNGAGELTASLPLEHHAATPANFIGDREVTVLRDDEAVWNGPITGLSASRSGGVLDISAREASWHLLGRVLEEDRTYSSGTDVGDIIADLNTYAQAKVSTSGDGMAPGSDIVADLPRWHLAVTGSVATTQDYKFFGSARHTIGQILDLLQPDPDVGFEWRMDYATGSTRQSCSRTLTVGVPALGVTRTRLLTDAVLSDYGRTLDWEEAATRVHVVGSGYTQTLQNSGAVTDGLLLSERVVLLTDTTDHGVINSRARDERRLAQPPVRTFEASFTPGSALPFGWCDLGDELTLEIAGPPMLALSTSRRLIQVDVTPPSGDAPEDVSLTFNLPLSDLGD